MGTDAAALGRLLEPRCHGAPAGHERWARGVPTAHTNLQATLPSCGGRTLWGCVRAMGTLSQAGDELGRGLLTQGLNPVSWRVTIPHKFWKREIPVSLERAGPPPAPENHLGISEDLLAHGCWKVRIEVSHGPPPGGLHGCMVISN